MTMIQAIIESNVFLYAAAAVGMLGVLCQIMISRNYGQLIKETANRRGEKRDFLRQLRFQYQTNRKRSNDNTNISVFVRRSLMDFKYMHLRIHQWRRLAGGLYLAAVGAAAAAAYYAARIHLAAAYTDRLVWMAAGVTAVTAVVWLWTDIPYKASYLQTALEDFLYHTGLSAEYDEVEIAEEAAEPAKMPAVIGLHKKKAQREAKAQRETKAQRDKRELKASLAKETAAENWDDRRERGREILKQMDTEEKERIIRDVLAEFLA